MKTDTKTQTVCTVPLTHCFRLAEGFIGNRQFWLGHTPQQNGFISKFLNDDSRAELRLLKLGSEIKGIASPRADEINKFLRNEGFQISLPSFRRNQFGVASRMDVRVAWQSAGKRDTVLGEGGQYPGIRLDVDRNGITVKDTGEIEIVSIPTLTGDVVSIAMVSNRSTATGLAILEEIGRIDGTGSGTDYGAVIIPMVNVDQQVDVSWLQGIETDNGLWFIEKALQQNKFKMNLQGARAESAAAMTVTLRCVARQKPDLIIDRPFYLWIRRPGMIHPLFAGVFGTDCWQDPGEL